MNVANHLKSFALGTMTWIGFFLAGLPDYYQQYSTKCMVVVDLLILFPIWGVSLLALGWLEGKPNYAKAVLLSFYVTVPLFVYDLSYCGLYLGHGWDFLLRYWYLTTYYLIPWIILLPTARWLDRRKSAASGR